MHNKVDSYKTSRRSLLTILGLVGAVFATGIPGRAETQAGAHGAVGSIDHATLAKIRERCLPPLPRRTILIVIDGLALGAIERLPLAHLEKLKTEGTYYRELVLPLAAHPRLAAADESNPLYYPWSCSIPNPVMMTGTLFIGQPGIKETLLQHAYKQAGKTTAFVVDSGAYKEIAGGYDTFMQDWTSDDDTPVFPAVQAVIEKKDPHFIRVHLQSTGAGGYIDQQAGRTIWHPDAEYRRRAIKADLLISTFIGWLKDKGYWNETVVFICGDHGQADRGGHAPYEANGDKTSLLVAGKGIKSGATFPYAEMTDLAPTIAYLQDVPAPRYSQGRILTGTLINGTDDEERPRAQEQLNEVMRRHQALTSRKPDSAGTPSDAEFLVIEQIGTWHQRFRDLPTLLAHQQEMLKKLEARAEAVAGK